MYLLMYHLFLRLRKLTADYEHSVRSRDHTIQQLNRELQGRKKELESQAQTIRELKDLLETSLKPTKPTELRHRLGKGWE